MSVQHLEGERVDTRPARVEHDRDGAPVAAVLVAHRDRNLSLNAGLPMHFHVGEVVQRRNRDIVHTQDLAARRRVRSRRALILHKAEMVAQLLGHTGTTSTSGAYPALSRQPMRLLPPTPRVIPESIGPSRLEEVSE